MSKIEKKAKYRIYRNLNNGQLSIRYNSLVIGHCTQVNLFDVTYPVSKAANIRVMSTGVREVHAYIFGCIYSVEGFCPYKNRGHLLMLQQPPLSIFDYTETKIKFNPLIDSEFYSVDNVPLDIISDVTVNASGLILGRYDRNLLRS